MARPSRLVSTNAAFEPAQPVSPPGGQLAGSKGARAMRPSIIVWKPNIANSTRLRSSLTPVSSDSDFSGRRSAFSP